VELSWIYYFFVAIPEATAYTFLAFALLNLPLSWKNITKIGILYGTSAYLIRHFPISFGVHTVILITIFAILLSYFTNCKPTSAFLVSLVVVVLLGFAEIISGPILMRLLNVTYDDVQSSDWLLVIFILPQVILFITLAFFIRRYHFMRGKINETNQ